MMQVVSLSHTIQIGLILLGTITTMSFLQSTQRIELLPSLVGIGVGLLLFYGLQRRSKHLAATTQIASLVPLLLAFVYWRDMGIPPMAIGWMLWGAWWLALVLHVRHLWPNAGRWVWASLLVALILPLYGLTMATDFGSADTFEFQVTAPQLGIAHPTGYPLYLLLGKLWTLIPFGTVAWRLNLASVAYALIALILVYRIICQLFNLPPLALLVTLALAVTPTFWQLAIEAEVYTLHAVFVGAITLLLIVALQKRYTAYGIRYTVFLAFLLGLGLTNHLTTILLLPAVGLTLLGWRGTAFLPETPFLWRRVWWQEGVAFVAPLALYAYLPLRWRVVNGEAMGFGRFLEWVTGTRFAGALQLGAWLDDGTRYAIIGRIFLDEWGAIGITLILLGFLSLLYHNRRAALILAIIWLTFTFYCLNYYVPDLNVFLLPAHLVMTIFWGSGPAVLAVTLKQHPRWRPHWQTITALILTATTSFILFTALAQWAIRDRSTPNPLRAWGEGTLSEPLNDGAAILADSDKFPPLYYLQQAESWQPNLDISVLPDEAAYRANLEARLGDGQTVYLARFLPRLPYAMRSAGPLVEIVTEPTIESEQATLWAQDGVGLLAATVEIDSHYGIDQGVVRLQWQAQSASIESNLVRLRWMSEHYEGMVTKAQHPVNGFYPFGAWQMGEVVADFHLVPLPVFPLEHEATLEIALAPAFTSAENLTWHPLKTITLPPATTAPNLTPIRPIISDNNTITHIHLPSQVRPNAPLPITIAGNGSAPEQLQIALFDSTGEEVTVARLAGKGGSGEFAWQPILTAPSKQGIYQVVVDEQQIATVVVKGIALSADAVNYDDKIALLDVNFSTVNIIPNGSIEIEIDWQALTTIPEDYTVFIQLLDQNDTIIVQSDSWPVQGTYPTTQWQTGELIYDPYQLILPTELPDGDYRLVIGWYLLRDFSRLPVLDSNGDPIDDKLTISVGN